jgi:hypothetical protein
MGGSGNGGAKVAVKRLEGVNAAVSSAYASMQPRQVSRASGSCSCAFNCTVTDTWVRLTCQSLCSNCRRSLCVLGAAFLVISCFLFPLCLQNIAVSCRFHRTDRSLLRKPKKSGPSRFFFEKSNLLAAAKPISPIFIGRFVFGTIVFSGSLQSFWHITPRSLVFP